MFGALTHVTNCTLEHVAPNWSKNLYRTFYFVLPPSWEYLHTLAFESTEKQRQGARFGQPWISRFIEPRCWLPSFPLWYKIYQHRCGLELVFWGALCSGRTQSGGNSFSVTLSWRWQHRWVEQALIMQDCFGSPSYELGYECYVQVPGWYRSRCVVAFQECTEKITGQVNTWLSAIVKGTR